ncbi:hypothetical protein M9Y10_043079 [Tritrichomonas musculus]|uniref:MatE family protein n=1 Tax=Tritrichomonas musculus TaxID=1915356 RepID=A0ABR2JYP2_9EUKA
MTNSQSLYDSNLLSKQNSYTIANPNNEAAPEELRFSGYSPFVTLLIQSVGPLIYYFGNAIHDAVDIFLISKALGEQCLQIVGFSSVIRFLLRSFAVYFSICATARVPSLIGEHRKEEAAQVITDLYRLTLISMIIMPVIFYFISKPILVFMGCTEDIASDCLDYLFPIIIVSPFVGIFQMCCGFLQGEGRSILDALMQLLSFTLNCGLFGPALLFGLKVDIKLAGLPFALSQIFPSVILLCLIFKGKFNLKPTWSLWVKKFSKETFGSLKLGLPFVLNIIAGTFPPMYMMNLMMKAAGEIDETQFVANSFSVFLKIQPIINSFSQGLSNGMLASCSYANGANDILRMFVLFGWELFLSTFILSTLTPLMIFKPDYLASIWMSDDEDIDYARQMLRIPYYTNFLNGLNDAVTALLQSANFPWSAIIPSLVRGAFYIIGAKSLYVTNKKDPVRMMVTYVFNDLAVFLADVIIAFYPFWKMVGKM